MANYIYSLYACQCLFDVYEEVDETKWIFNGFFCDELQAETQSLSFFKSYLL